MNKVLLISIVSFLLLLSSNTEAQFYIGKHSDDIKEIIKEEHPYFKLNTSDVNTAYKYLKYEDRINEITALLFLDEEDKCKMVRIMYDYANINDVLDYIKKNMEKVGENTYEFTPYNERLTVAMKEEDWFFTLTVKAK